MADESNSYSDLISRRRFVELTGVTGAAALAGCDGDGGDQSTSTGDGTDDPTSPDGTATPVGDWFPDAEHISVETSSPGAIQFNRFNSADAPSVSDRLLFEKMAQYSYAKGKFVPAALTDWNLQDGTFTMNLRDDLTWSNGNKLTADDIVRQLQLGKIDEASYWEWTDSVTAVDDTTVELEVSGVNKVLVEAGLFTASMIFADEETYGDLTDASKEDLNNFRDEDPVTNGPFTFDSKNDQQMKTQHVKKSDSADNPWAENINFGTYTWQAGAGNTQRLNALKNLTVDSDFSLAVSARTMSTFPDALEEANYYDVWGYGIYPNHNHKHAGDRAVRQAIAYAINREACVNNSLPRAKRAPKYALGISDVSNNQSNWLGDAASDYETYGKAKTMNEKVTSVMEAANYSKADGTWTDPDGNTVSLPVTCPGGWGDWMDQAQTIRNNLQTVGFKSSVDTMSGFTSADNPLKKGDFVLGSGPWLHGGPLTHPYFSLQHNLSSLQMAGQEVKGNYPAWSEQWGGSNAEITVPSRTGSGDMTVDPTARIGEMSSTNDSAKIDTITKELAWVSNVDLPTIPIVDKVLQQWLTSDDWTVPEDIDNVPESKVQFAPTWMPRKGKMNWRGN